MKHGMQIDGKLYNHGAVVDHRRGCSCSRAVTGSVAVGDRVMILDGYPMHRGLIGVVQRFNTAKEGWCYVTSGGRIYSCNVADLLPQNTEHRRERK